MKKAKYEIESLENGFETTGRLARALYFLSHS